MTSVLKRSATDRRKMFYNLKAWCDIKKHGCDPSKAGIQHPRVERVIDTSPHHKRRKIIKTIISNYEFD
jgi:hypothetical protein